MAGPLEGVTDEQMLRMVHTNLMGPIRVTKAFTPHFREKRGGLFINTTSIGGLMTVPLNSMYHGGGGEEWGWREGRRTRGGVGSRREVGRIGKTGGG